MNFFNTLKSMMIPRIVMSGFSAIHGLSSKKSIRDVGSTFVRQNAATVVSEISREALYRGITPIIPYSTVVTPFVNLSTNAIAAVCRGEALPLTGQDIRSAVIGAASTAVCGPILGLPVAMTTNKVADKACEGYRIGYHTAYENFKNHSNYTALGYRKNMGAPLAAERVEINCSDDLSASFVSLSYAAPAA